MAKMTKEEKAAAKEAERREKDEARTRAKPENVDYTFDLERPYEISIARRDGESATDSSDQVYWRMRFTQRNENGREDIARFKDDAVMGLGGLESIAHAMLHQIEAERAKDVPAVEPPVEGEVV